MVSDVAGNYFQLLQLDYELEISQSTLETRRESLRLVQERQGGGVATLLDLRQAEQLVSSAAESIPTLQQQTEQAENRISLLLGRNSEAVRRGRKFLDQQLPPEVPAGLPSALLDRTPSTSSSNSSISCGA